MTTVSAKQLQAALKRLVQFTGAKGKQSSLVILRHVLIEVSGQVMHLSTTNLEQRLHLTIPCSGGDSDWALTILAQGLLDATQDLQGDIALIPDKDTLRITTSDIRLSKRKTRHLTNGTDPKEFPGMGLEGEEEIAFTVDAEALRWEFKRLHRFVGNDKWRPAFSGVQIEMGDRYATLVAASTYAMAVSSVEVEDDRVGVGKTMLLPATTLELLFKALPPKEKHIHFSARHLVQHNMVDRWMAEFFWPGGQLVSRVIQENFPAWRKVVMRPVTYGIKVNAGQLTEVLTPLVTVKRLPWAILDFTHRGHLDLSVVQEEDLALSGRVDSEVLYGEVPAHQWIDPYHLFDAVSAFHPAATLHLSQTEPDANNNVCLVIAAHGGAGGEDSFLAIVQCVKGKDNEPLPVIESAFAAFDQDSDPEMELAARQPKRQRSA